MSRFIFWTGKEVLHMEGKEVFRAGEPIYAGMVGYYCVDTKFPQDEFPKDRYGILKKGSGWVSAPLEDFPKEFRVHLLLLGVT